MTGKRVAAVRSLEGDEFTIEGAVPAGALDFTSSLVPNLSGQFSARVAGLPSAHLALGSSCQRWAAIRIPAA